MSPMDRGFRRLSRNMQVELPRYLACSWKGGESRPVRIQLAVHRRIANLSRARDGVRKVDPILATVLGAERASIPVVGALGSVGQMESWVAASLENQLSAVGAAQFVGELYCNCNLSDKLYK